MGRSSNGRRPKCRPAGIRLITTGGGAICCGALDTDTGRIERAVSGWAEALTVIDAHPDTGARLVGTSIRRWRDVVGLVSTAAALLPGIGTQSWDIAVTDHGPVILEVNFGGDLNLSQIASGRGALEFNLPQPFREAWLHTHSGVRRWRGVGRSRSDTARA